MRKRELVSSFFVVLFLSVCIIRLGYIAISGNYTASVGYNSYSLIIDKRPCNLYYSDYSKLTNNVKRYTAVIKPNEKGVSELHGKVPTEKERELINFLKSGKPVVYDLKSKSLFKYNQVFECYETENTLSQLINKSSNGLLLNLPEESLKVSYKVDAMGKMLSGDKGETYYKDYYNCFGYVLTIDKDIQKITYDACKDMKSGCAIVMNVKDSSILSIVTKPDSTYINKPFQLYSAGSVFKIITTLCALENGIDIKFECTGKYRVGDTEFSCQNNRSHSTQNLKQALANSCNCYFVNLALLLGSNRILKTAEELGFNETTKLYNNFGFTNAVMPSYNDLLSKGELSLFGFGQGKLEVSPIHFCNVMCTVADKGRRNYTRLIKSEIKKDNSSFEYKAVRANTINPICCNTLCDYLRYTVSDGTAKTADYKHRCAGKTATAQTGQFKNGKELYNTWFAGFYPYIEPKYAIVIMTENGISGSVDCCPVFRTIVENIDKL